jgi:hypothetical protein
VDNLRPGMYILEATGAAPSRAGLGNTAGQRATLRLTVN